MQHWPPVESKVSSNTVIFTFLHVRNAKLLQKTNPLRMPSVLTDPCSAKAPRIVPMLFFFPLLFLGPILVSPVFSSYYLINFMGSMIRNFSCSICCAVHLLLDCRSIQLNPMTQPTGAELSLLLVYQHPQHMSFYVYKSSNSALSSEPYENPPF